MFDEKTILARLQNGEDIQKIADEMAAVINSANKAYVDEQTRKAEEARKAEELKKAAALQKTADLQDILDQLAIWFNQYYDVDESVWDEIDADSVLELIDSVQEYIKAMSDLTAAFGIKKPAAPVGTRVIKSNTAPKTADDKINDFLKNMGW